MITSTVVAEGIAQKADSAEEMHREQNETQPARGPRETSSLRPSNVISSSDSEHVFPPAQIQEQIVIKRGFGALTLLLLFFLVDPSLVQSASVNPPPQKSDSLGDSLRHSEGKEIHIFYIHGIRRSAGQSIVTSSRGSPGSASSRTRL